MMRIANFLLSSLLAWTVLLLAVLPTRAEETEGEPPATETGQQEYGSVEERRLMEAIEGGEFSVLAREREKLEERKKELKRLEEEVDKKLEQLNQLRQNVEKLLAEKDAVEQKRVQELAKVYEKMTADKAATVLATVDQELAIAVLKLMKTKAAAKILNSMDREKAAKLTTGFSTLETD